MAKTPKQERFVTTLKEGNNWGTKGIKQVIVDQTTGVNYLVVQLGYGTGITPLLDQTGKPIVTK